MEKRILTLPKDKNILKKPCVDITNIDKSIVALSDDLLETLRKSERPGVGIAAPQIGVSKNMIVIESTGWKNEKDEIIGMIPAQTLINPIITKYSEEKIEQFEGCLSVPENNGYVVRPKKIKVTAKNLDGKTIKIKASGFYSRVLQHEIDHLNGILFVDRIKDKSKLLKANEFYDENRTEE